MKHGRQNFLITRELNFIFSRLDVVIKTSNVTFNVTNEILVMFCIDDSKGFLRATGISKQTKLSKCL